MSWCTHFHFLQSKRAMEFVRQSRIMFIMRGMPGSGKTTIVKELTKRFPTAIVCSADKFMHNGTGDYSYDRTRLASAHEFCRFQAAEACSTGQPVIVDNTNLKRHEYSFYMIIAQALLYDVVVVEPRTPWACNPQELAKRSLHGLTAETCQRKVNAFRSAVAFSYGWFLNLRGTDYVCRAARRIFGLLTSHRSFLDWYRKVVWTSPSNVPSNFDLLMEGEAQSRTFKQTEGTAAAARNVADQLRIPTGSPKADQSSSSMPDVKKYKQKQTLSHLVDSLGIYKSRSKRLYLETAYARRGHTNEIFNYVASRLVMYHLGSIAELCVTGFFFTRRTIGARVHLTAEQCQLWQQDTEFSSNRSDEMREVLEIVPRTKPELLMLTDEEIKQLSDEMGSKHSNEDKVIDKFCPCPSDEPGATAHIAIGAIKDEKPGQAGIDLYEIIQLERKVKEARRKASGDGKQQKVTALHDEFRIDSGVVRQYAGGFWVVYLDNPIQIDGLFTGSFSR